MRPSDLQRRIEPLAKKLAADLTAIIAAYVGGWVDGVRAAALGFVHQELDDMFAEVAKDQPCPSKNVRTPRTARRSTATGSSARSASGDLLPAASVAEPTSSSSDVEVVAIASESTTAAPTAADAGERSSAKTTPVAKPPTPVATTPSSPPPIELVRIVSLPSRRPPRRACPTANVPPPGWSIESDRAEEFRALSELTLNRKSR